MKVDEFCLFVRDLKSDKGYILSCLLGLNPLDVQVYEYLEKKSGKAADVMEIAKRFGIDRSTAQRSLQKLVSAEICQRIKTRGKTRGYKYVYKLVPREAVKSKLKRLVGDWSKAINKAIEEVM